VPTWLRRWIDEGLGGLCLFGSNLAGGASGATATADLAALLHDQRPGLVVALDEEGGDVTRVESRTGSSVPGNAALGAVDDLDLTREVYAGLGRLLAALGIDLDLAPCADVNVDVANPVIGVRSFGAAPALVARHVAAAVEGLQGAGVAACAKHFPGHGATRVDSHRALPTVDVAGEVLLGRELVPFRAAIDAGVRAVMTAHLVVPSLDARPATVSRVLLADVLRDELGFTGAVVTDALDMQGIGGPDAIPANVVRALAAGADLCCLGSGAGDALIDACVEAVVAAVRSGVLDEARLADAAERVGAITVPGDAGAPWPDALADLEKLGADAARRAVRVEGPLPRSLAGAHVVEIRRPVNIAAGVVPSRLGGPLEALDPAVTHTELAPDDPAPALPGDRPLVVVVRDLQTLTGGAGLLERIVDERPDAVVVDLGWPAGDPPRGQARVSAYGASRAGIAAVAELLTTGGTARG
jgi:beta-N-acetylhexosaminidase